MDPRDPTTPDPASVGPSMPDPPPDAAFAPGTAPAGGVPPGPRPDPSTADPATFGGPSDQADPGATILDAAPLDLTADPALGPVAVPVDAEAPAGTTVAARPRVGRPEKPGRRSVFLALCGLMLRTQVTRTRLISLGALSALALVVGWALGMSRARSHLNAGTEFVNTYGLSLLVPVAVLVFASSMFGDPTDDGTLVYLWLRPVSRVKLVLAAACTSFVVTWPLVVPPLVAAAALTRGGTDLVRGTLVSATVMVISYTGVYLALGVRVKRPLVWGLLYIFIWEGFVARGSANAAKAAIRAYGSSILHSSTGTTLVLADIDLAWAVAVPLALGVAGLAYAVWRLHRQDVA